MQQLPSSDGWVSHAASPGETGAEVAEPKLFRRWHLVTAGALVVAALGLVITGQVMKPPKQVRAVTSQADTQAAAALRAGIATYQQLAQSMPDSASVAQGLKDAATAAADVASQQDDYRFFTAAASAVGGDVSQVAGMSAINLALRPDFALGTDASVFRPWYLLVSDENVPAGTGVPFSFDSGFQWIADTPLTVGVNGMIPVRWQAVQTRTGKGSAPDVLAWARADFDLGHRVFTNVTTGVTASGKLLALPVTGAGS